MPNYQDLTVEELRKERERAELLLVDAQDERSFLGKQTSMHIKVAEFKRLDADIEKFQARVDELDQLLSAKEAAA